MINYIFSTKKRGNITSTHIGYNNKILRVKILLYDIFYYLDFKNDV